MKKTLLKTLSLLLSAALLASMIAVPASASTTGLVTKSDSINSALYFWGGTSNTYTFTYADGTSATANLGGMCTHYVDGKVAYCIEPQTSSTNNTSYTGTAIDSSTYWTKKLTAAQRHAISLILLYGAPNHLHSSDTYTEFGYEGATQILIWEIIMGLRSAVTPYTRTDARLYNTFKGNRNFPSMDTAYAEIISLMQNHLTIPSFSARTTARAPEIVLDYNASNQTCSTTVTDTNGVLASDYSFTATGVTMTKSGNSLTITAPLSALQSGSVLASATGRSLDDENMGAIIWTCPGKQSLITTVDTTNDPVRAYFTLAAGMIPGTTSIRKTSNHGSVEGYCFKLYKWGDNLSWYGKSETDGRVYVTDSGYNQSGTRTYSFTGLTDGTYTILEALSRKGLGEVFPDSIHITITQGGFIVYDHTFTGGDLTKDTNGDCRLNKIALSGLTDGGSMELTIHNAELTESLEIIKRSDDGNVSGIAFTVFDENGKIISESQTDESGHLTVPGLKIGKTYTVLEREPTGYYSEDPEQQITIQSGTNTVTFVNHLLPTLKIIKTSESGVVQGFSFTVFDRNGESIASGTTDESGLLVLQNHQLMAGETYTVTEKKSPGYVCADASKTITLHSGVNEVSFYNRLVQGSIEITKVDPDAQPLAGVSFLLAYSVDGIHWEPVRERKEGEICTPGTCTSPNLTNGTLTTGKNGIAKFTGLCISSGTAAIQYRLTETATLDGYSLLTEPVFVGALSEDTETEIALSVVNTPVYTMPATGGKGFPGLIISVVLLGTSLFLTCCIRKKEN